jgi:hypothetical protein
MKIVDVVKPSEELVRSKSHIESWGSLRRSSKGGRGGHVARGSNV